MRELSREPVVSVIKSNGYYEGSRKALKPFEDDIAESIKGKQKVLIKPNFVSTAVQLAATHVDTIRAVLDLLSGFYDGEITIGEGPAGKSLVEAITNFGYDSLIDEYRIKTMDLNEDEFIELEGVDRYLKPLKFCVSKTLLESDYLISVAKPKTHDTVIVTLSIKNVVVGSLVSLAEKEKIHQGAKAINENIARIGKHCIPDLALIDGFVGMEGAGPVDGDPVSLGVSSASLHPVSLDSVMAKIMGFDPLDIGYLHYLNDWGIGVADLDRIKVVGEPIEKVYRKFRPHPTYRDQLNWR
ncbi:hypothetical protein A3K78_09505 [Candidatus Bathyarchaeota archaeon RBG_13_52_12]|nr:MAG: hypothetical protein A3K78_09505 [Candidatus Bathyarchaeota archaeon RBG_13_52_12]